jgi:hypothetical protein
MGRLQINYENFCSIRHAPICLSYFTSWAPLVNIRTNRFNIQQFYVLPTQCICVFCLDLRTNSSYFLYSINWLVLITETESVCYALGCLSPRRSGFDPRSVHLRLVVDKLALGKVFLPVLQCPLSLSTHQCSILDFIYENFKQAKPWNMYKSSIFSEFRTTGQWSTFSVSSVQTLNAVRDWRLQNRPSLYNSIDTHIMSAERNAITAVILQLRSRNWLPVSSIWINSRQTQTDIINQYITNANCNPITWTISITLVTTFWQTGLSS